MDERFHTHIKIEKFIEDFRNFADNSMWRAEDDSVALFAIGNVEDWLRTKLAELLN